jgi:hypothetical protein
MNLVGPRINTLTTAYTGALVSSPDYNDIVDLTMDSVWYTASSSTPNFEGTGFPLLYEGQYDAHSPTVRNTKGVVRQLSAPYTYSTYEKWNAEGEFAGINEQLYNNYGIVGNNAANSATNRWDNWGKLRLYTAGNVDQYLAIMMQPSLTFGTSNFLVRRVVLTDGQNTNIIVGNAVASGTYTGNGAGITNAPFDAPTNTFTINSVFPLGQTNQVLTAGSVTGGITGIGNGPTKVERSGMLTVLSTGTLIFTNPVSVHASDYVQSRTITNGNTCIIVIDVIPGRCTNMAIMQFL